MAKGKEVPKHIKEFYEKDRKVKKLLDTTQAVHTEAYQKALETIRDKEGQIDYEMLEDIANQDRFLDKMMDHYLVSAAKAFGLKGVPKDELEQDILLQRYIGVTKGRLKNHLRKVKSEYTLNAHEKIRDDLVKKQREELLPLRHSHFEREHIKDILLYTGTKDYLDPDRLEIEHAAGLLNHYKEQGEIPLSHLEKITSLPEEKGGWGSDVYLTPKGKESIKALKEKYKKAA